jgi:hypothetical protein
VYLSALYKTPMFAVNRASGGSGGGGGGGGGGRGGGVDPLLVRADARVASMLTLNSMRRGQDLSVWLLAQHQPRDAAWTIVGYRHEVCWIALSMAELLDDNRS